MSGNDCRRCLADIDRLFLVPRGVLKILEMFLNIGAIIFVATGRTEVFLKYIIKTWVPWGEISKGYTYGLNFALATACVGLLATVFFFFLFLFRGYRKCCGFRMWTILDCVFSALAFLLNLVSFVVLCIFCGHWPLEHTIWNERLIAGAVFAILAAILYLADCIVASRASEPPYRKKVTNKSFT